MVGETGSIDLLPRTIGDFHLEVAYLLDRMEVGTEIWPVPVEIPGAVPLLEDRVHASYDAESVHRFWRVLVDVERVTKVFASGFVGKASPVHFFWGAAAAAAAGWDRGALERDRS